MKKTSSFHPGRIALALALTTGLALAGAARADEWRDHERGARDWHRQHVHYDHGGRPVVIERNDPYVVYPPPVVYAPPESEGLNLVFPIHIR